MGYWRGRDDYWDGYERTSPLRVKDGLKTKSERGAIGATWWSKRWVGVLESFNMGTRLTRGRAYARQGQVISIDVEPGQVTAKVQGSMPRPYNVKIRLEPLSAVEWDIVTDKMAAQAIFAAKLLAGEMPTTIEEAFSAAKLSLFPTKLDDLHTDCSCPDWANPCKHIAAVYYLLAERFDEDPFLIFKLRGRTKEQIIEALRSKRAATLPPESTSAPKEESSEGGEAALLEENLASFWQAREGLETFVVKPGKPDIDKAVLKRLGDAPFKVDGQNLAALLAKAYDAIAEAADHSIADNDEK
jgi:uncharacterized Zn finger protein